MKSKSIWYTSLNTLFIFCSIHNMISVVLILVRWAVNIKMQCSAEFLLLYYEMTILHLISIFVAKTFIGD